MWNVSEQSEGFSHPAVWWQPEMVLLCQGKLKENTVLSKDKWFCCAADWFFVSLMQNSQENELHSCGLAFKQKSQGSQSILETTGALTYQPGCSRCYLLWRLRGRRQFYLHLLHFYSCPYLCLSAPGIYSLVWAWAKGFTLPSTSNYILQPDIAQRVGLFQVRKVKKKPLRLSVI